MPTLGTAYVQIVPSAEGISGDLTKALGGPSQTAGKDAGSKIGSAMKKYITAAAIGTAIKKSIEEGAKLEQSLGGVETLYKNHANTVIKNANKAWKTAGLSANEYMEQSTKFAASLLQSLGGDTKQAAKYADMAIIDMSDNANKFGTNIVDIQNAYQGFAKQNYTMLDNLKLGYGGTKTEMERLLQDASKLSGQEYDISNLSDVYDAIHVIQQDLGVTGTTSKEAASTLAGSFAAMKSSATNFMGSLALGKNVGPALSGLITSASTFLFNNLIPALIRIGTSLPGAIFTGLKTGIPQLAGKLPGLIKQVFAGATSIVTQISEFIMTAVDGFANNPKAAEGGLKIIKKIALGILSGAGQLALALGKLALTIPKAITSLIGKLFGTILSSVGAKITQIVTMVKTKFNNVKEAILKPIRTAKDKLSDILNKIKSKFASIKPKLSLKIPKVSLSGGKAPWGIAGKGKLPSFHVKWAAKGGIVDGATLIGAGEKGKEAIVPLDPFWDKMEQMSGNVDYERLAKAIVDALSKTDRTTVLEMNGERVAEKTAPFLRKKLNKIDARNNRKLGYA